MGITSKRTPLEDHLTRLLESNVRSARDCRLVRRVLGWDGQRGSCLKDAGEELGITRERARQIYDQSIERIPIAEVSSTLDETLAFVSRMSNRWADDIEAEMQLRGFTRYPFAIGALLKTAQVFGRVPDFAVEKTSGKWFVVAGAGLVRSITKAALRSNNRQGVQTVSALHSAIPTKYRRRNDRVFIRQVLNTRRDIRWLDVAEETFWLAAAPRNPMVRCVKKVLCYASPVAFSDLYRAIGRLPANRRAKLSLRLFIKFCEQAPFCRVADGCGERVAPIAAGNLISGAERVVCRILRQNGNELSVGRLQSLCASAGVPKPNLWRIILYSPLIYKSAPRVYRVITASSNDTEAVERRTA
ncbi:MAG: hypothetical protein ACLPWF_30900 [Bryobacteraceae bacterium]